MRSLQGGAADEFDDVVFWWTLLHHRVTYGLLCASGLLMPRRLLNG
ncbi:MAG: hypothetical protein ACJ72E_06460 [Marmoricola sp.]